MQVPKPGMEPVRGQGAGLQGGAPKRFEKLLFFANASRILKKIQELTHEDPGKGSHCDLHVSL